MQVSWDYMKWAVGNENWISHASLNVKKSFSSISLDCVSHFIHFFTVRRVTIVSKCFNYTRMSLIRGSLRFETLLIAKRLSCCHRTSREPIMFSIKRDRNRETFESVAPKSFDNEFSGRKVIARCGFVKRGDWLNLWLDPLAPESLLSELKISTADCANRALDHH